MVFVQIGSAPADPCTVRTYVSGKAGGGWFVVGEEESVRVSRLMPVH